MRAKFAQQSAPAKPGSGRTETARAIFGADEVQNTTENASAGNEGPPHGGPFSCAETIG